MSTPKRSRVSNRRHGFLRQVKRLPNKFMAWLLRLIFVSARFSRTNQAGFVLPTTVLLLLILTLTVSALSFRSFSRSAQVIAAREQQTIDNIAAPAIDRAKAKLEYMFLKDARFPGGVPSSEVLQSMMLNDGENGIPEVTAGEGDPYTFPKETRLDIDEDGSDDNAWVFETDVDGTPQLIAYSILMDDGVDLDGDGDDDITLTDNIRPNNPGDPEKAREKVVRNGPISTIESAPGCASARGPERGWYRVNTATVQKNFQITAFAANDSNVNRTTTALEFQQVRQADRGNKWGAWFKYDLELFPGAADDFLWNGAMHTEGNFITRGDLKARLVSSPESCLYEEDASEITLAEHDSNATPDDATDNFEGQAIFGTIGNNRFGQKNGLEGEKPDFDLHDGPFNQEFQRDEDSVDGGADEANAKVIENIALDPVALFTKDFFFHRSSDDWTAEPGGVQSNLVRRIFNDDVRTPFLDDTFRADDRYGPKPDYDPESNLDDFTVPIGRRIIGSGSEILNDPVGGLDGYWERQAIDRGLRIIVGQRLELGNTYGWQSADDPLYPVNDYGSLEQTQRRSLRDNLAAVQGMVVYHYETNNDGDGFTFPLACVASTVHPGTEQTILNSRSFESLALTASADTVRTDFLEGVGTNGWEFGYNTNFDSRFKFRGQYNNSTTPLKKALTNLAYFAGDPNGGAPSFEPVQDDFVHPFPWMAMWGDFSVLRRIIDNGFSFQFLSPADQATVHSATCTLGLLAYNLQSLQAEFDDIEASGSWSSPLALDPEQERAAKQFLQVLRDRTYGFNTERLNGVCDDATLTSLGVSVTLSSADKDAICPAVGEEVKYPSLHYLFPRFDHDQSSSDAATDTSSVFGTDESVSQPETEEYIDATTDVSGQPLDTYLVSGNPVNDGLTYQVVNASDPDNFDVFASPVRLPETTATSPWKLPRTLDGAGTFTDPDLPGESMLITNPNGGTVEVSLLDKGMYDGRELIGSRMLDVDIDNLTSGTNPDGADHWIADVDGVVYAFREDALREDSIVRPKDSGTEWVDCDEWAENDSDPNCRLSVIGTPDAARKIFLQDPPLPDDSGENKITVKPVDFYADPARRPYGFRLINGTTFNRGDDVLSGMTFVSDNSVYIKGNFNLHTTDPTNAPNTPAECDDLLEEFTERLDTDCDGEEDNDFYGARNNLNTENFAAPAKDSWRPAEVVGDAVGVLSASFIDGHADDGFMLQRISADGAGLSSYQNQNRPAGATPGVAPWYREDGSTDATIPIQIDRDGNASRDGVTPFTNYLLVSDYLPADLGDLTEIRNDDLQTPSPTRVNAVFVSGIIPSRAGQTYGGMHNFPRFLEYWDNVNLYISGGFFQLNFSTAATAPFDQEALEPGNTADVSTEEFLSPFYGAPTRVWGYDVGLQYAPAAPVARRFVTVGRTRSEFYRELPVDDPYVENLRCALTTPGGTRPDDQVDPFADCA